MLFPCNSFTPKKLQQFVFYSSKFTDALLNKMGFVLKLQGDPAFGVKLIFSLMLFYTSPVWITTLPRVRIFNCIPVLTELLFFPDWKCSVAGRLSNNNSMAMDTCKHLMLLGIRFVICGWQCFHRIYVKIPPILQLL